MTAWLGISYIFIFAGAGYVLQLRGYGTLHSWIGKFLPFSISSLTSLSYQGGSVQQLKSRGVALGCVRTLVVVAEERPRIALCNRYHSSIDQNLNLVSFSASQRCSPRSASHRAQSPPRSGAGRTSRSACKELPLPTPPPSMLISGRSGALLFLPSGFKNCLNSGTTE